MSRLHGDLERALAQLDDAGLRRRLDTPRGIDFASNDYLGLAGDPLFTAAVRAAVGDEGLLTSPASRLLRGTLPEHDELEAALARFKGTESALIFPTGYQANLGVLTALIGPDDRVLSDELNHASIIDGLLLTRATRHIYGHLDTAAVESSLREPWPEGRTFIVTESYFSMDGDVAPLDRLADLADEHDAALIVDDAHATGVFGAERGAGLIETFDVASRVDAVVSTFGKALGAFGAFVGAPAIVREWLINRARSFIFTTALPPLVLRAMAAGIEASREQPWRRERACSLAAALRDRLRAAGLDAFASEGPIVPVLVGDNRYAVEVADEIQRRGFDVRAVRPPTVAPGTARLRVSVHADRTDDEIDRLAATLIELVSPDDAAGTERRSP